MSKKHSTRMCEYPINLEKGIKINHGDLNMCKRQKKKTLDKEIESNKTQRHDNKITTHTTIT